MDYVVLFLFVEEVLGTGVVSGDICLGKRAIWVVGDTTEANLVMDRIQEEAGRAGVVSHEFFCMSMIAWIQMLVVVAWMAVGVAMRDGMMVVALRWGEVYWAGRTLWQRLSVMLPRAALFWSHWWAFEFWVRNTILMRWRVRQACLIVRE